MQITELMTLLNNGIMEKAAPLCTGWERIGLGMTLAAVSYKIGGFIEQNKASLVSLGAIDNSGNIDVGMVKASILNGIPFPLNVGNLKFEREDFVGIFDRIISTQSVITDNKS